MALDVIVYGTGNPATRRFRVQEQTAGPTRWRVVGEFTIRLDDIPDLMRELQNWLPEGEV